MTAATATHADSVRVYPLRCNCAQYFSWRRAPPAPALPLRLIYTANVLTTVNIGLQSLLQAALGVSAQTRTGIASRANTLTPARGPMQARCTWPQSSESMSDVITMHCASFLSSIPGRRTASVLRPLLWRKYPRALSMANTNFSSLPRQNSCRNTLRS